MADKQITAVATETGKGVYQAEVNVSGHMILGDEPEDVGGENSGPAPMDLLVGALAECTAMTVRFYARQQNWPLQHVSVTVTHRKGGEGAVSPRQDMFSKQVVMQGTELTGEQRAKLIEIAAKCPIQRVLEGTPQIHTQEG